MIPEQGVVGIGTGESCRSRKRSGFQVPFSDLADRAWHFVDTVPPWNCRIRRVVLRPRLMSGPHRGSVQMGTIMPTIGPPVFGIS